MSFTSVLRNAAKVIAPAAQLATTAVGLREAFRGPSASPTLPQATQAAQQQAQQSRELGILAQQLLDPESDLLARLEAQEEEQLNREFSQGIAQLLRANQRQQRLGNVPVFDPERGEEDIFRAVQSGRVAAKNLARQKARERVGQAAGFIGNGISGS